MGFEKPESIAEDEAYRYRDGVSTLHDDELYRCSVTCRAKYAASSIQIPRSVGCTARELFWGAAKDDDRGNSEQWDC